MRPSNNGTRFTWLLLIASAFALAGCFGRSAAGVLPDGPGAPTTPIETVSNWSLWAGAACIPIAALVAILLSKPRLAASIAISGICLIVSGWVVGYIESHKGWFLMAFAVVGIVWYVRAHPRLARWVEDRLNVDIPLVGNDKPGEGSGPHQTIEDAAEARRQADIPTARLERVQPASASPAIASEASVRYRDD